MDQKNDIIMASIKGFQDEYLCRKRLPFWLGSITILVVGQLDLFFLDWILIWNAALFIADGGSLYTLTYCCTIEGMRHGPPYQMPLFIYFLAGLAYIGSERFARFILSLFIIVLAEFIIILLKQIWFDQKNSDPELDMGFYLVFSLLFFLNLNFLLLTYFGLFDQIPLIFVLLGLQCYFRKKYMNAGLAFGLGTMSKLFPIILVYFFGIHLLKSKKRREFLDLSIGFLISTLPIVLYFYFKYNDQFFLVSFQWQLTRDLLPLSIWRVWFPFFISSKLFITFRITILLVAPILMIRRDMSSLSIIWSIMAYLCLFVLMLNVILPHYVIWPFSLMYLVIFSRPSGNFTGFQVLRHYFSGNSGFRNLILIGLYIALVLNKVIWVSSSFNSEMDTQLIVKTTSILEFLLLSTCVVLFIYFSNNEILD